MSWKSLQSGFLKKSVELNDNLQGTFIIGDKWTVEHAANTQRWRGRHFAWRRRKNPSGQNEKAACETKEKKNRRLVIRAESGKLHLWNTCFKYYSQCYSMCWWRQGYLTGCVGESDIKRPKQFPHDLQIKESCWFFVTLKCLSWDPRKSCLIQRSIVRWGDCCRWVPTSHWKLGRCIPGQKVGRSQLSYPFCFWAAAPGTRTCNITL